MTLETCRIATPVGPLTLFVREGALVGVAFEGEDARLAAFLRRTWGAFETRPAGDPGGHASRLRAYFAGDLAAFEGAPIDPRGTPFQRKVWQELLRIPAGTTVAYSDIARRIGAPDAVRAVGAANGANPIPVVIPCHRVVARDGSLHGYGGGLDRKRRLLEHEGVTLGPGSRALFA